MFNKEYINSKGMFTKSYRQSEQQHLSNKEYSIRQHQESLKQSDLHFCTQYKQSERQFFINYFQNTLYHYKDMNMNERSEIRENLRDELIQKLTIWDTTMVCTTLLLGSTFEFIAQGTTGLSNNILSNHYYLLYGLFLANSLFMLFISLYSGLMIYRRLNQFNVKYSGPEGLETFYDTYCYAYAIISKLSLIAGILSILMCSFVFSFESLEVFDHPDGTDLWVEKWKVIILGTDWTYPQIMTLVFPAILAIVVSLMELYEWYLASNQYGPYKCRKNEENTLDIEYIFNREWKHLLSLMKMYKNYENDIEMEKLNDNDLKEVFDDVKIQSKYLSKVEKLYDYNYQDIYKQKDKHSFNKSTNDEKDYEIFDDNISGQYDAESVYPNRNNFEECLISRIEKEIGAEINKLNEISYINENYKEEIYSPNEIAESIRPNPYNLYNENYDIPEELHNNDNPDIIDGTIIDANIIIDGKEETNHNYDSGTISQDKKNETPKHKNPKETPASNMPKSLNSSLFLLEHKYSTKKIDYDKSKAIPNSDTEDSFYSLSSRSHSHSNATPRDLSELTRTPGSLNLHLQKLHNQNYDSSFVDYRFTIIDKTLKNSKKRNIDFKRNEIDMNMNMNMNMLSDQNIKIYSNKNRSQSLNLPSLSKTTFHKEEHPLSSSSNHPTTNQVNESLNSSLTLNILDEMGLVDIPKKSSLHQTQESIENVISLPTFISCNKFHINSMKRVSVLENLPKDTFNWNNSQSEELSLAYRNLGYNEIRTLFSDVNSRMLANLTKLDLSKNKINCEAVRVIAQSEYTSNIEVLDLNTNKIEDEGLHYLSLAQSLRNLETLDLSYNLIDKGVKYLVNSETLESLTQINLRNNRIQDDVIISKIIESDTFKNLKLIDLRSNNISYEAIQKNNYSTILLSNY